MGFCTNPVGLGDGCPFATTRRIARFLNCTPTKGHALISIRGHRRNQTTHKASAANSNGSLIVCKTLRPVPLFLESARTRLSTRTTFNAPKTANAKPQAPPSASPEANTMICFEANDPHQSTEDTSPTRSTSIRRKLAEPVCGFKPGNLPRSLQGSGPALRPK
jgi:hypothetical protein